MVEVVLFHHVQGLTDGVQAFAEELRSGGHTVHTPDLFDGERPASIEDGVAYAQGLGDDLDKRADSAVGDLPAGLVYAGFSSGAGTRSGWRRPGRGRVAYCCTSRASRSPAIGRSVRGRTGCQCRSTAKTRIRSSRWRATSTPPVIWWRRSGLSWASCSSIRATSTCSPTVRCRRTTPRPQLWWCSARVSSSTGSPDVSATSSHPNAAAGPTGAPRNLQGTKRPREIHAQRFVWHEPRGSDD